MSDTAYVITSGEYSDYRVDRVYLDKGEAQAYVDRRNGDREEYYVEEFQIGAGKAQYDGPGWYGSWSSSTWRQEPSVYTTWVNGEDAKAVVTLSLPLPSNALYRGVTVQGTSREHVEKALYDAVAQIKAELAGIS